MGNFVKVASVGEIAEGTGKPIKVGETTIALFNVGGRFYAINNTCLHRGGPLGEGDLDGNVVTCPWHGWFYDVTTGCYMEDESKRVACYVVKVDGDSVLVEV